MTDESQVAYCDTETLGLDPDRHPIWEIAVIVDDVEHCWQVQVTDWDLERADPVALDINGFRDRYDEAVAMHRRESIARFVDLVQGRHLVGAVPSFDEERLRGEYNRWFGKPEGKYPWHYHLIDVEALAVGYLTSTTLWDGLIDLPWKSTDLSDALDVESPGDDERHTALADARWGRAMYQAVMSS